MALIILLSTPVQPMSAHRKRWTFNTWRLHATPASTSTTTHSSTKTSASTVPTDINQILLADHDETEDQLYFLENLLQMFKMLEHERNDKTDGHQQ